MPVAAPADLSSTIPIFPLTGVLLLPRGVLPLNIFEPRYLNMVDDALSGDRLIGMIQPRGTCAEAAAPEVYSIGCAGRIASFEETDDGRYLIALKGVSRYTVMSELPTTRGYRRVQVDWEPFGDDLEEPDPIDYDRDRFLACLMEFFERNGLRANWQAVRETPDERLITSLAMICPFEPPEKQALLEAPTLAERADLMTTLLEMSAPPGGSSCDPARH
ncbi:MAG: LON peptidase substrate-binding domain-containing protein [Rhodospirillaceae bacterium]|nr:LON peptidase substrate-binding domain-containing protein [Rhodospirillaceae bacterium]